MPPYPSTYPSTMGFFPVVAVLFSGDPIFCDCGKCAVCYVGIFCVQSLAAQVVTDSCQGKLLKFEATGVLFPASDMERSRAGLLGSLPLCGITLCAGSANAGAGTLLSSCYAIRSPSRNSSLSVEAMHAFFIMGLGGHKDSHYRKV